MKRLTADQPSADAGCSSSQLRSNPLRGGFGVVAGEAEAEGPLARDKLSVDFGGSKLPLLRSFLGEAREILARAGRVENGRSHVAVGVYLDADTHSHRPCDGPARAR